MLVVFFLSCRFIDLLSILQIELPSSCSNPHFATLYLITIPALGLGQEFKTSEILNGIQHEFSKSNNIM